MRSLHEEVVRILLDKDDAQRWAVVFPSLRPSFFMDRLLAKRGVVFPPRAYSLKDFWRYLLSLVRPVYVGGIEDILPEMKAVWEGFVEEFSDWDRFYPWARSIFGAFEQTSLSAISDEALSGVKGILSAHDPSDLFYRVWEAFPSARRRFYERLLSLGTYTRALVVNELLAELERGFVPDLDGIVFAGLFLETERERELIKRLKAVLPVEIILLAPSVPVLSEVFERLSADLYPAKVMWVDVDVERVNLLPCTGDVDQSRKVGSALPKDVENPEECAVVLPKEDMLIVLLDYLMEKDYPVNVSMGYPLKSTAGASFVELILRLAESSEEEGRRLFIPHYRDLIQHYYLEPLLNWQEISAVLSGYASSGDSLFVDREELDAVLERFEGVGEVNHFIGRMLSARRLGDFAEALSDMLWWVIRENRRIEENELERQALYNLYLRMREMANSPMGREEMSLLGIGRYLRSVLYEEHITFEGTPLGGLQVLGPLQARGLGFRRLHYLNLNEGVCPKYPGVDVILPDPIRGFLRMPLLRERELLYYYDFYSAVALSEEVYLYYVDHPSAKSPMSRFIHQLEYLAREQGKELRVIRPEAISSVHLLRPLKEIGKSPSDWNKLRRLSPSAIDTYITCPVGFYYRYIAEIPELAKESEELEAREIGTLVHEILARLYSPMEGKGLSADFFARARRRIASLTRDVAQEVWGRRKAEGIRGKAILKVVRERLRMFLDYEERRWQEEGFVVDYIERDKEETFSFRLDVKGRSVILYGRADRIDRQRDGTYVIWDYKTGHLKSPKVDRIMEAPEILGEKEGEVREYFRINYQSVQLPIYALALSSHRGIGFESVDAGLISLKEMRVVRLYPDKLRANEGARTIAKDLFRFHLAELLGEMLDEKIPYLPDVESCPHCPYRRICRFKEV